MQKRSALILAIALGLGAQAAFAQSSAISGQVVKVDQAAKKITIKHGQTGMAGMDEGMTMVYAAPDPSMLTAVKAGDKIKFESQQVNGQYTLTKIEKAK